MKIYNISNAPKPVGPYSHAVVANNIMFISGQIPVDPVSGKMNNGDITEQTDQVMSNVRIILSEAGLDFRHIVKCSIFLADMDDFDVVNKAYAAYFPENPPARECIQAARLPKNSRIEISVIATTEI